MSSPLSRHSTIAHVNKLPPENLAYIFNFLRVLDLPCYDILGRGRKLPCTGWIFVTYVCRRWRSVALDDPRLWIDSFNCNLIHDESAIKLVIDFASLFQQHFSRMKMVQVAGTANDFTLIMPAFRMAAPALESFSLHTITGRDPLLPADLFNQIAPRLRCMSVSHFGFLWSSLTFSSLVELSVSGMPDDNIESTSEHQTFEQFLLALTKMPALWELSLSHALPPLPADTASDPTYLPYVTLPQLDTFQLDDEDPLKCMVTLKHIVTPSTTSHEVTLRYLAASRHDIGQASSWFISRVGALPSGLSSLTIQAQQMKFEVVWDSFSTGIVCGKPTHVLNFFSTTNINESLTELEMICKVLPLACLERLCYDAASETSWNMQEWFSIFGKCKNVCKLDIYDFCPTGLLQALTLENPLEGQSGPLFPSLDCLTLGFANLGDTQEMCEELVKSLTLRKHLDPLRRMDFTDCEPMSKDLFEKLRGIIPDLQCQYCQRDACSGCSYSAEDSYSEDTSISDE
ncbi:hypothetical protein EVG20_g9040 [Dentipellis fragilis]|uniref:Uncharacterized protein n=1 Tax=Dentipellis fragilis TaxID=205917 RepID=A0A4Y9Y1D6_9AGAM|nr:hypothetical protein EVG20_g9040 [Dentipellis fragilis]